MTRERSGTSGPRARGGLRFLRTAAIAAGTTWLGLAYVAQPYRIHGASMAPTLESGERVLVNKLAVRLSFVRRGDVVVFRDPAESSVVMVKRVVAVPGDTVRYVGDAVTVVPGPVGGDPLDAAVALVANASSPPPSSPPPSSPPPRPPPGSLSVTVAEGEYFLVGDNRDGSSDSRHWGALSRNAIIGEAVLRIFPWDRIGFLSEVPSE